ncbi:MAG TPA: alpha/beta fold hydrolase [Actinomycetes bacterium]|nr:alpha/beta fold hydrolase [Actinomycetes bacterium]
MSSGRRLWSALIALGVLITAPGCTGTTTDDEAAATNSQPATESSSPASTPSTATATPSPTADRPSPVSLQALMAKEYNGRQLRVGRVLASTSEYTRHFVTYKSGKLTISGIMNVPDGNGPFPVLILNHGYIDPAIYTNGRGLAREQDYLAREGYVVLHTDYRNHAQSDDDPTAELTLRLGYTEDVINAVLAVKRSRLPYLDKERIGLLGRSMGGGVTLNALVVKPGLVDAAVVFAPVSSNTVDNFNRWIRRDPVRNRLAERIIERYGSPERNPQFWRDVSPRTFFDRITEPILIHHGTDDESCPIRWSRQTLAALDKAGKDTRLFVYQGEHHAFIPDWPLSMRRTVAFFDRELKT